MSDIAISVDGPPEPTRLWNPEFVKVLLASLFMYTTDDMLNSLLAKYVGTLHGGAATAGTVAGIFSVTAFLGYLVAGSILDQLRGKYILVGALVVMSTGVFGFALSGSVAPIVAFRLLQGLGLAFSTTAILVLATRALPTADRSTGIRYLATGTVLCQAFGPGLGLQLAEGIGYRGLFTVGGALLFLGAVTACTLKPQPRSSTRLQIRLRTPVAKEALLGGGLLFLATVAYFVLTAFVIVYAHDQGVTTSISYFFMAYAATLVVVNPLVTRVIKGFGTATMLMISFACQAGSLLVVSFSHSLWMFMLSAVLLALGYGVNLPLLKTVVMASVPDDRHGVASSTGHLGKDVGTLVGGVLGGFLAENLGYAGMWRLMVVPLLASIVITLVCYRRINHPAAKEDRLVTVS